MLVDAFEQAVIAFPTTLYTLPCRIEAFTIFVYIYLMVLIKTLQFFPIISQNGTTAEKSIIVCYVYT